MVYIQESSGPYGSLGIEAVLDSNGVQERVWIRNEVLYVNIVNKGLDIQATVWAQDHLDYSNISEAFTIEVPRESNKVVAISHFEPLEAGPRTQCLVCVTAEADSFAADVHATVEIYA